MKWAERVLEAYDSLIGKTAVIQGRVLEDPDIDKKGQTVLRLSDLRVNGEKLAGQLWVVTADKRPIKRSDIVQVQGKLTAGFGAFSASMYRAKIGSVERPVPGDNTSYIIMYKIIIKSNTSFNYFPL